jgi:hypothetical protein
MKTIASLKIIISLIAFVAFVLVLNSCKKTDFKNNTRIGEKSLDMIRANVAKQMEHEGGIPQIFVRNQKVTTQWVDRFHNPVTNEQLQKNSFTSQCNYDLPAYCNLVQYARVYRCGSNSGSAGYFLQFEYEISWNNNIIKDDGNSNLTSGYINIVDGSSNIVQSLTLDYTNSDVQIVEIGPDPNPYFPNNYIFRVKFVTTDLSAHLVSDTYINSGSYAVKISAMFVSDCSSGGDPYSLWLVPVTAYGFTGASGDDPCDRHDKAWVDPAGPSSNILYASGYNSGINSSCGFGGSFTATDLQEIQYNVDGGTWTNMDNYIATSLPIYGSPFVRAADASRTGTLPSGDHLIGVRYRNWKYVLTNPSGWPIPDFNDDCFSPGDNPSNNTSSDPYSTYAYSYWYCINIP